MPEKKTPQTGKRQTSPKTIRIPAEDYANLLELRGLYPGLTMGQLASELLRRGMRRDVTKLASLRKLQRKP